MTQQEPVREYKISPDKVTSYSDRLVDFIDALLNTTYQGDLTKVPLADLTATVRMTALEYIRSIPSEFDIPGDLQDWRWERNELRRQDLRPNSSIIKVELTRLSVSSPGRLRCTLEWPAKKDSTYFWVNFIFKVTPDNFTLEAISDTEVY